MSRQLNNYRIIAIEEHFSTEEHIDYLRSIVEKKYSKKEVIQEESNLASEAPFLSSWFRDAEATTKRLIDTGAGRLQEMDESGIDMQVLSLISPGVQVFDAPTATAMAKRANDRLRDIVKEHPDKFAGLAAIAPQNPTEAADELERAVKHLGLKGACINSHTKGEYLDDNKYWVIFERAEKLGIPIYIHPRGPSPDMIKPFLTYPVLASTYGFGIDTGLHALRLICSGVFDVYPKLQIILGHFGEALPFWLWRINESLPRSPIGQKLNKTPIEYLQQNFFLTTSGMFWQPALMCTYLALGADKILFAVDHPFQSNKRAVQFMDSAPICDDDKEKIYHLNSEKLFSL